MDLRHQIAHKFGDTFVEFSDRALAILNLFELLFPLSRQFRAAHLLGHQADKRLGLFGRVERFLIAQHIAGADQFFYRFGSSRRRTQARFLHRLGQLVVLDFATGIFHCRQKRGVGIGSGRLRFFFDYVHIFDMDFLALL